jgi:hypothetical protein
VSTPYFPIFPIHKVDDPLEKDIEAAVKAYASSKGIYCRKFSSPNHISVPDDIFIYSGNVFFVEFKRKGKLPTPAQSREHTRIREQGIKVYVIDNVADGRKLIDDVIEEERFFRADDR